MFLAGHSNDIRSDSKFIFRIYYNGIHCRLESISDHSWFHRVIAGARVLWHFYMLEICPKCGLIFIGKRVERPIQGTDNADKFVRVARILDFMSSSYSTRGFLLQLITTRQNSIWQSQWQARVKVYNSSWNGIWPASVHS